MTALFVVAILVIGAAVASLYVSTSVRQGTDALALRDYVFHTTGEIQSAISDAEVALNRAMITPSVVDQAQIESNLARAHHLQGYLATVPLSMPELVRWILAGQQESDILQVV